LRFVGSLGTAISEPAGMASTESYSFE